MKYKIKKVKGCWPKSKRKLVKSAIDFSIKYYGLKAENEYPLKIKLTSLDDIYGDAWYSEDYFEIRLADRGKNKILLRSVFHEMCHIKQFVFDGLELEAQQYKFLGRSYKINYWNTPWEIEAKKMEKKLLQKYKKVLDF